MKKIKILLAILVIVMQTIDAQDKSKLLDPNIRYGVLDNGMTYYILHNEEPKDRASFYIMHNVGAMLEEDNQNGLAHMLEHMAFNGSKNFKGKGVKNFLERQGVEFGKNINAYTNLDETVYNISNVPTVSPGVMDSCVLILHDWSGSLTLAGEEIDAERGVIKEEWRTRNNAGRRLRNKLATTTYYESKYATRDVIGSMDVIENSPYSAIRSFYEKWYRPDIQAVVIVGDFDVDAMETRVKTTLSKIPKPNNTAKRIEYLVGDNKEFLYDFATDEEAQYVQYRIMIKHPVTNQDQKGTQYMLRDLMTTLYAHVIRERLANIQQKPESPFIGAQMGYFNFVRTMDAYYIAGAKPEHIDVLGSMKALLIENERVRRHGITATELGRAKIKVMKSYDEAVKNKTEVSNDAYAMSLKDHFLVGEPKMGADIELQLAQSMLPQIAVEQINEMVSNFNREENMVITIQGPSKVDFEYPTRDQISDLLKEVRTVKIDVFVDNVVTEPLMVTEPVSGKVVSTTTLDGLEAKEYILSNGAKVVIYPTDKNKNQVLFQAYSPGGKSQIASVDLPSSDLVTQVADMSGISVHSLEDLKQLLVGKQVSLQAKINANSESLEGSSTPEDIETLFQLIYLTFESPRFEKESFESISSQKRLQYKNASSNLSKIFRDSVRLVSAGGQLERRPIQNLSYMNDIKFDRIEPIYNDRIKDAGDFVFVFVGAIEEASFLPLIEKYIASISDSGKKEEWKDDKVRSFGNGYEKVFNYPMETAKQTNYIKYKGERKYSRQDELVLSIAKGILSERYFKTVREQEGGSYGVSVYNRYYSIPFDNYYMVMYFDCNPEKADKLVQIIHEQMKDLIIYGANEEEFKKSLEGMIKTREQSMEQNGTLLAGIINNYSNGVNTALTANYEDILSKTTLESFNKAFAKIMGNSNTVTVIMKPE